MKKRLISLIIAFLCVTLCFSGCGLGSYIENGNNNSPSTDVNKPTKPDDKPDDGDEEDTEKHYTADVWYNNQRFTADDVVINVVWRNEYDIVRVELGADGTADAGVLDGDYSVYLEGLPEKYAYNPNQYKATSEERYVSILLTDVLQPTNASHANGKNMYTDYGCYSVKYDGTYRVVLDDEDDLRFYEYAPPAAGYYSIVSWVNVYDDKVNPLIDIYGGSFAFKFYTKTLDGGGASLSGGYTKNFRYEVRITASEIGGSFSFAIHATSKFSEFPMTVDFAITYEGQYTGSYENVKVKRAEERLFKADNPKPDETFVWANLGSKRFEMSNYKFNEDTGRYHFYNMKLFADDPYGYGEGYGPVLLCAIDCMAPSYSLTALINANSVGLGSNYLRIYGWIEEEQTYGVYDYTQFIREDYYKVCNSEGFCNVTKELKKFLHLFAVCQSLYTDGTPLMGTPEDKGYHANEDAMWLFPCGFYYKGGLDALLKALN